MDAENPLAQSQRLLWEGLPQSRKGPKPTLTLEQIVVAGIAIADAEGVDALSMRKLAAQLGMGTMSLYRYIPTKDDLLTLMLDHVNGKHLERLDPDAGWRPTLETVGWRSRELNLTHCWLLQVNWSRPVLGPNSVADLDRTLSGLRDLPFSDKEKMMVISLLDSYVTGSARQEILYERAATETGMTDEEFWGNQYPVLAKAMQSGEYPTMAAMDEDVFDGDWDQTFAFGLGFLLDGVEREVARRTQGQK